MTDTEKILNLLEINDQIPTIVAEDDGIIISGNNIFSEKFNSLERGYSFYSLFDKNTSLLIKNCLIDAKIFLKIQRRDVQIKINSEIIDVKLIISPFKLDTKIYFFILLFNNDCDDDLLIYPTLDDGGTSIRYKEIIHLLEETIPKSLIEKKNLQSMLELEKEAISIKDRVQFLFMNSVFQEAYSLLSQSKNIITIDDVLPEVVSNKLKIAENEVYNTLSQFVVEKNDLVNNKFDRAILFPILNKSGLIDCILITGNINSKTNTQIDDLDRSDQKPKLQIDISEEIAISNSDKAQIIYDKSNFDIYDANDAASTLYGYELEELKRMNITKLFVPEDMQKLILPPQENGKFIFKHITKSGEVIEVNVERENILWNEKEAYSESIILNQVEEEVIKLDEYTSESDVEPKADVEQISELINNEEAITDFLSSMFHEMLTPINVILGFVQEIIDSIDNPTEEQEESAKIIKDNQTVLLHTMNTAVQYAQLHENKIPFSIEKFDLNNYLVDLQDSFSRTSDKKNTLVVFEEIPEPLELAHDRTKLLASISYFIKFIIKLSQSSKIFISFETINNDILLTAKDSESGISETVLSDIIEIFNTNKINDKKNYGISSITIRLAKKLNELLSCSINKYFDKNGIQSIALKIPSHFTPSDKADDEIIDTTTKQEEKKLDEEIEHIKNEFNNDQSKEVSPKRFVEINHSDIENGDIDEKIIEDIEEEEEIVTEEIATIEDINSDESYISKLSCLFIDDNVDTQLLFKSQMKDFNLLKVCSNFTDALPLLNKYNFDLIIVDINLNDTYNGLDALKIIRQFPYYKSIPIIAVTAYSFDGDKEKFLNFGFTDYFVKPLLREQLLKSLELIS